MTTPNDDAAIYSEGTIAAILTLATIPPQTAGGHSPEEVVQRYREVLQKLKTTTGGASHRA
jgi:hypothetical protein